MLQDKNNLTMNLMHIIRNIRFSFLFRKNHKICFNTFSMYLFIIFKICSKYKFKTKILNKFPKSVKIDYYIGNSYLRCSKNDQPVAT